MQCHLTVRDEQSSGLLAKKPRADLFLTKLSLVAYKLRQKILQNFVLFTEIQIYAN